MYVLKGWAEGGREGEVEGKRGGGKEGWEVGRAGRKQRDGGKRGIAGREGG